MNKSFICTTTILGLFLFVLACDTGVSHPRPAASKSLAQKKVKQDDAGSKWIDLMGALLPAKLCEHDSYFRDCFKTTEQECEIHAVYAVRSCLDTHSDLIKADFQSVGQNGRSLGKTWGSKIGQCAGAVYRTGLQDLAVNNARCAAAGGTT
jgi:hypothetical protein